jgi:hypothetical protein
MVLSNAQLGRPKRRFWTEMVYRLCQKLTNSERIFNTNEIFSVHNCVYVPGPGLNWVANRSWQPPGTVQPAFRQKQRHSRHPGNTSWQTRQHISADRQTVIRHPGNTFGTHSATLSRHNGNTFGTHSATVSRHNGNTPSAQSATATLTRHGGKTSWHILRT